MKSLTNTGKSLLFTFVLLGCLLGNQQQAQAQAYQTAIGFRFGLDYGLSLKTFVKGNFGLEFLATTRMLGPELSAQGWGRPGFNFCVMTVWNIAIPGAEGLAFVVGPGAHVGYWRANYTSSNDYVNTGVDAMVGMEYTFANIPLTLQFDWKPSVNIFQQRHWRPFDFGLTGRYVFGGGKDS